MEERGINRKRLSFLVFCMMTISITLLVITMVLQRSDETTLASLPSAQVTRVHEGMFAPDERLARPPMSDPPTQVELGHYDYWMSCMVCHGDRGQGLTDEWRGVLDPEDQNCWQSKCHAANHPPEGFQLPTSSPPVMGEGTLVSYKTAADLFEYLRAEMPWPFPGLFEDEEYWQLTAFLADVHRVPLRKDPLGPDNAANVLWRPQLARVQRSAVGSERLVTVVALVLLLGITTLRHLEKPVDIRQHILSPDSDKMP